MIKFRAWDKVEKEWLEIKTLGFWEDNELWYLEIESGKLLFEDELGVKWELLQYTGLCDIDGNEIYIGDILKVEDEYTQVVFHEDNTTYGIYLEDKEGGGNPISDYSTRISLTHIKGTIKGNQYEHPHLLEE